VETEEVVDSASSDERRVLPLLFAINEEVAREERDWLGIEGERAIEREKK
jgi:hypothetical protein